MNLWWFILGLAIGIGLTLPLMRTLLRRGEVRARAAERRARDAERLAELGAMTGGLAHEIRNPLSTIGLNAQLLREGLDDASLPPDERDRLQRRLESLSREIERLSGILSDFLQFAGRVKLDPKPTDLRELIDELSDFFHPQCEQARVLLRTQLPPSPLVTAVDAPLLKQAVLNLMINATQAMEQAADPKTEGSVGELILSVEQGADEARIRVMDTGPGIAPEHIEKIFHPYVSHRSGGTGLGLPTSRRIVEEHGGRLDLVSEVGRGSEFVVHLPVEQTRPAEAGRTNPS